MTDISSVGEYGGSTMYSNSENNIGGVSQQEFLSLLIAQLQHQDPMEPQGSQEFAAQLAQFTQLEELQSLNSTTQQGVETNLMLSQTINNTLAATMVGKDVKAVGSAIQLEYEGVGQLSFELGDYADSVEVSIYDAAGNKVETINMSGAAKGLHTIEWDGTRENGEHFPQGEYSFSVEATNQAGEDIATDTVMLGTIDAVRYTSSGAIFVVNGEELPFSSVIEVGQFLDEGEG